MVGKNVCHSIIALSEIFIQGDLGEYNAHLNKRMESYFLRIIDTKMKPPPPAKSKVRREKNKESIHGPLLPKSYTHSGKLPASYHYSFQLLDLN